MIQEGDYNQLHPHSGRQALLDSLRFGAIFIYLADLCLKIAYYQNSRFISM